MSLEKSIRKLSSVMTLVVGVLGVFMAWFVYQHADKQIRVVHETPEQLMIESKNLFNDYIQGDKPVDGLTAQIAAHMERSGKPVTGCKVTQIFHLIDKSIQVNAVCEKAK